MAQPQIVIAGGGVIGAATAYYLAQKGRAPLVVEACTVAASASGKAGGFLALDWCDSSALGPLARKSFALHAELADTLDHETGYRKMTTHNVTIQKGGRPPSKRSRASLPAWVTCPDVAQCSIIGTPDNTAQVHPERLTKALLAEAEGKGGRVMQQTEVVAVDIQNNTIKGVRVRHVETGDEETLPADVVVFAMGAWSSKLASLLPSAVPTPPAISGLKVHSIVVDDPDQRTSADALFLSLNRNFDPEIYPRPDKTVYCCGVSSEELPTGRADQIEANAQAIDTLRGVVESVCADLADAPVITKQACFLPCSDDGLPLIGRLPGLEGAYIATGHSCWGILNAPATGLGLAELIVDGKSTSVDLSAFDSARFLAAYARQ